MKVKYDLEEVSISETPKTNLGKMKQIRYLVDINLSGGNEAPKNKIMENLDVLETFISENNGLES